MNYLEYTFHFSENQEIAADILISELAEIGFESFVQDKEILKAYIPQENFNKTQFEGKLMNFPLPETNIGYTHAIIEETDWNHEWEKHYFQPIEIEDKCIIRSSFHQIDKQVRYEIIIDPKMAFGTGHHETTYLMLSELLEMPLEKKSLLDMGCGTAVLAILAAMRGATPVTAIDIDPWAYENAKENIRLNKKTDIKIHLGGAEQIKEKTFDCILANINRNILLNDMPTYAKALNKGGILLISGFYASDIPILKEKAEAEKLLYAYYKTRNDWTLVKFTK